MEIIRLNIDDLTPDPNNAKEHPEWQVEQIKASIETFGNLDPIGVWGDDNLIVEGHGRYLALKELGYNEAECIRLDWLTEEERRAYALAHNKLTMNSGFDLDALKINMDAVTEIDMSLFGFDNYKHFDGDASNVVTEEENESDFDDIEKLEKHYGVPYQGNKSRIADIIINILPSGKRLCDLFGGGGAITHCAILSGKWESFLYNDLNEMITGLFMDAIHGKYHDEKRVITREDFEQLKDTDAYVKYIWSFGNNGKGYLWGQNIEEIKCQACRALLSETVNERRLNYVGFIKLLKESEEKEISLHRLQSVEHLQALCQLEALQRLEVTNKDYREYKYKKGDVVYCDVPYEQLEKGKCDDYGVNFNSLEFYEWVKAQPYQVFFSSYEISDERFYKVKIKAVASLIGANTNGQKRTEYLYSNKPIEGAG